MKTTQAHPFVRLFGRYLRDQGFPMTQQRASVAGVVFGSDEHLSVEEIEGHLRARGERIGKATIYRTLDLLVRSKLVDEHDFGEGFKRYEHRLSRQPVHEHLICLSCGRVTEFRSSEILRLEERVAREHGFRPSRHKLEIYGLCADCRQSGARLEDDGLTCPIESI
ncbi:MAG: Fur family transcriptional regulator [Gammaproteobacteria bacterium]|nr:Fur family transcriptional regulator [Gammaproteobacteria bacterium]